ncbi:MAG: hypothetical protein FJ264_15915 [Planctomycetes bacterium]|nr:hypothetical protein [Planctomycetota bacterium]
MSVIIPDLQWYLEQSACKNISPRCPFATVQSCPRFYQSLSLLGDAGSTKIPEKEDKKLFKKWKCTPLWPITKEQATSISGYEDNHFWNFCPEVSFGRFDFFASDLDRYADEIDKDLAHSNLSKIKTTSDDWRWSWANIKPQHYSECPLYSVLLRLKTDINNRHEDIIDFKPNFHGIGLNINALIRKIKRRIKGKDV